MLAAVCFKVCFFLRRTYNLEDIKWFDLLFCVCVCVCEHFLRTTITHIFILYLVITVYPVFISFILQYHIDYK
jgi:hypothetical protein